MKRNFKIIASVILIVALLFSFSVTANGNPLVIAGAAVATAGVVYAIASAMGVDLAFSGFTDSAADDYTTNFYSGTSELSLTDFVWNKAQTIPGVAVAKDVLTISGSAISAILGLGSKFITDNNISDNSSGSIVNSQSAYSVNGYDTYPVPGMPAYMYYLGFGSPIMIAGSGTYTVGGFTFTIGPKTGNSYPVSSGNSSAVLSWYESTYGQFFPCSVYAAVSSYNSSPRLAFVFKNSMTTGTVLNPAIPLSLDSEPNQSLTYSSGTVDTSFGSTANSISIAIPQSALPSDASVEDILDVLTDLAIGASQDVLVIEDFVPTPTPTPVPVPTDPLGEVPYNTWMDTFGSDVVNGVGDIVAGQDDIVDTVGLIGEDIVDSIDTYGQAAVEAIEDQTDVIDTYGQSAIEAIENQTDVIDTIGQTVSDVLESIDAGINDVTTGIRTKIDTLTDALTDSLAEVGENVIEAVKQEVLGDLGKIESGFSAVISRLRSAFSIWHYVVEWLGSIGTVFGWIMGAASGTSYYMILPIYACIAGGIVLGVYRRFGR